MSSAHPDHSPTFVGDVAVVLGGGGAAGNAWLIGVVAGLADAGVDLTRIADLLVGTSAGATAAAMIGSTTPIGDLYAAARTAPPPRTRPTGARGAGRPPGLGVDDVFDRLRAIGAAATTLEGLLRASGAFALECDPVLGSSDPWRAVAASRLPAPDWPTTRLLVTAVDARTGSLVTFDRDSGVALADAVAASTCLPGMLPTQRIGSGRYVDGGIRSSENADLAAGYRTVVVLAPLQGRTREAPVRFEGIRRFPGHDLQGEVAALRAGGSRVEVVAPDAAARVAMGPDVSDPTGRPASALAGFEQGRRVAPVLRDAPGVVRQDAPGAQERA